MRRLLLPLTIVALLPCAWTQDVTAPDARASFKRGLAEEADQQWEAAIADFNEAVRLEPNYLGAYLHGGKAYQALGRFDEAIANYSEIIRRDPAFSSAYFDRGSVYLVTHKPELALADAEEEIRQKPEDRLGYLLRSRAKLALGDETGAAADKAKAEELKTNGSGPQRIGGTVMSANLVEKVAPEYPSLARQARVQGTVRFSAVIGRDGAVETLNLISGHPLLVNAAKTAVQQWRYKPTLLNGEPVRVATTIDVDFTLQE